jgi:lipopolysaccharide/colanic/teichoic acid biosynthesis glycosyltransferase
MSEAALGQRAYRGDGAGGAVPATRAQGPPFDVSAEVARIAAQVDWDSFLPGRAAGLRWRAGRMVKRGLDIVLAGTGLVVLSPVLLLIAAAVAVSSPGPVLYEWRVLGRRAPAVPRLQVPHDGRECGRTEGGDAGVQRDERAGVQDAQRPAHHAAGRVLRKYSLDELPQLYSVLRVT